MIQALANTAWIAGGVDHLRVDRAEQDCARRECCECDGAGVHPYGEIVRGGSLGGGLSGHMNSSE